MSNSKQSATFEGITFKLVGQVVDITYYGVKVPSTIGNGKLGEFIAMIDSDVLTRSKASTITTGSSIVEQSSLDEVKQNDMSFYRRVRSGIIADHAELNGKISNFHTTLATMKKNLLQGRVQNVVNQQQLDEIYSAMQPLNVGKVLKLKLQIRYFSREVKPGLHQVGSGGYAATTVLYTMYVPYSSESDLQSQIEKFAERFRSEDESSANLSTTESYAVVNDLGDGRVTITPYSPQVTVSLKNEKTGALDSVPIESLRGGPSKTLDELESSIRAEARTSNYNSNSRVRR